MTGAVAFRGATVIDGTGADRFVADVVVRDGRVESVAPSSAGPESRVIDARGLVLAPGFIDMHAHSDLAVFIEPGHHPKIGQGVTTELVGQDGLGYVPADDRTIAQVRRQIAGWNGAATELDLDWGTVAAYLGRLDRGVATNVACLVPQGNLRLMVVGPHDRRATPLEIDRMRGVLDRGLRDGAVGLSSGLSYTPGMYADTDELVALCATVAEHGGFFAPHTRSYGLGALESYAEAIEIAERAGCALHLTHATMNFAVNRGRAGEFLRLVDDALDRGCDITLDSYPYTSGATTLAALLPAWSTSGGVDATLARLRDPADRRAIGLAVNVTGSDGCHGLTVEWDTIEVAGVADPSLEEFVGQTVARLAETSDRAPVEVFFELLLRDSLATTIRQHVGDESNLRLIMRHRAHTGGSDGILVGGLPHPRGWGTFPRYLGHYCRDLGLFSLEECIHHLTGRPASRLRLSERGLVRPGYAADLVLFDPLTVRDVATYDHPKRAPEGIRSVLVNGVFAIDDGQPTGAIAGGALRLRGELGAVA
ncbi:amidohydrolase family protein [Lacisediminihabitans sp.]|uniref:N-acyl-D-amino-acid deacylase family protein n=1 Tax=Lacisediminihabitans sp. TaxID=2787631 RepID=UPI00374C9A33